MQDNLFYKDILTLIFSNVQNKQYFQKYYSDSLHYQTMLRDYLKMKHETNNLKIKQNKNTFNV